jgi:hypothetical protein
MSEDCNRPPSAQPSGGDLTDVDAFRSTDRAHVQGWCRRVIAACAAWAYRLEIKSR